MDGFGFIPDLRSSRKKFTRFIDMIGVTRPNHSEMSLLPYVKIRDQLNTQACVGFQLAQGIQVSCRMGSNEEISPLAIYTMARMMFDTSVLIDIGSMPHSAVEGISSYGLIDEKIWPFDVSKVDQELPWDVIANGSKVMFKGFYNIGSLDKDNLLEQIKNSIAHGYPVFFGTFNTQPLLDYKSGILSATYEKGGGHALLIVAYEYDQKENDYIFYVANSWGKSYGEDGFLRVRSDFLTQPLSSHFYAISAKKGEI
jgi:hypothetical protein